MKKYIYAIISISLILIMVASSWAYLTRVLRPTAMDDATSSIKAFHMIPEDSVDVIVYGSSHSWLGVDTKYMQDRLGIKCFNYSCMWQSLNTIDLFVNDSFRTQSPRVAVVDVGRVAEILSDADLVGEIYYTRELANTSKKWTYLKECFGGDRKKILSYYLPFSVFHSNWDNITKDSFDMSDKEAQLFVDSRGFMGFENVCPTVVGNVDEYWQEPLSDEMIRYLDSIVEKCSENNTKVLFVAVPFYSVEYMYSNAMEEYCRQNGCDYLDFFRLTDQIGLDGDTDFSDAEHLNLSGADKMTDYLGRYILDNYNL